MRIGELTESPHTLKACDIHTGDNKNKVMLVLYTSKTHGRNMQPQKIKITENPLYKGQQRRFCPFAAISHYLKLRGDYENTDENLFIFRDGSPVRAQHVRAELKGAMKALGLDQNLYDTHSFRIGRATDLFKMGKTLEEIKKVGRWKSNAVYKYLRD